MTFRVLTQTVEHQHLLLAEPLPPRRIPESIHCLDPRWEGHYLRRTRLWHVQWEWTNVVQICWINIQLPTTTEPVDGLGSDGSSIQGIAIRAESDVVRPTIDIAQSYYMRS